MRYNAPRLNFAFGVVDETFYGAEGTPPYIAGLKEAVNWIVTPSGGLASRPGSERIGTLQDLSAVAGRKRMWRYPDDETLLVVLSGSRLMVIRTTGAAPGVKADFTAPWTPEQAKDVTFGVTGSQAWLCHPQYSAHGLSHDGDVWSFNPLSVLRTVFFDDASKIDVSPRGNIVLSEETLGSLWMGLHNVPMGGDPEAANEMGVLAGAAFSKYTRVPVLIGSDWTESSRSDEGRRVFIAQSDLQVETTDDVIPDAALPNTIAVWSSKVGGMLRGRVGCTVDVQRAAGDTEAGSIVIPDTTFDVTIKNAGMWLTWDLPDDDENEPPEEVQYVPVSGGAFEGPVSGPHPPGI